MKGNFPLVSVIVPNYNHEKYLVQRLECIFNQTYPDFEVILLDDCSSDKSQEILLEYAKNPKVSHCVFNDTNSGNTFVQWNKGIALAKGDYIWIAESDDFCELNFLEEMIRAVQQDSAIKLVYCQSNRVDEKGKITGSWLNHTGDLDAELFLTNFVMDGNEFIERFLIHKNVIPNASGVLFQKEMALALGELDINPLLKYNGDWLFYVKLMSNQKMAFVNAVLNSFRDHSQSVIAVASDTIKMEFIKEIEIKSRNMIIDFLTLKHLPNISQIKQINKHIVKTLTYEKAFYSFKNNKKIKGILILCTVLDLYIQIKLIKRVKIKWNQFFK